MRRKTVDWLLGDCWCGSFLIVLQRRLVMLTAGWNLASGTDKHPPRGEERSLKCAFSDRICLAGAPQCFRFPAPGWSSSRRERCQLSETLFQVTSRYFIGQIRVFDIQEGRKTGSPADVQAAQPACLSVRPSVLLRLL